MKMQTRLVILLITLLSLSAKCYSAASIKLYVAKEHANQLLLEKSSELILTQQSQDSTTVKKMNSLKLKSPYMAVFYSVMPGIAVHGAGHVYAGRLSTGILLFSSELLGAYLMSMGALTGLESGETSDNGDYAIFIGSFLFIGSWIYDAINSPIIVKKQNQEILKTKKTELRLRSKDGDLRLAFVYHF